MNKISPALIPNGFKIPQPRTVDQLNESFLVFSEHSSDEGGMERVAFISKEYCLFIIQGAPYQFLIFRPNKVCY